MVVEWDNVIGMYRVRWVFPIIFSCPSAYHLTSTEHSCYPNRHRITDPVFKQQHKVIEHSTYSLEGSYLFLLFAMRMYMVNVVDYSRMFQHHNIRTCLFLP